MSLPIEQYEKLMRFLDADMDLEEMEAFKYELNANPELQKQLDFEQSVRNNFATTKQVSNNNEQKINLKKLWLPISIAASILVIAAILLMQQYKKTPKPEIVKGKDTTEHTKPIIVDNNNDTAMQKKYLALFNEYFTVDKVPETYPIILADAFEKYSNENYTAIKAFDVNNVSETRGTDFENSKENILQLAHYYKAIALLKEGSTTKAMEHLNWVIANTKSNKLKEKAYWYLGLGHLKIGEKDKAVEVFEKTSFNKGKEISEKLNLK